MSKQQRTVERYDVHRSGDGITLELWFRNGETEKVNFYTGDAARVCDYIETAITRMRQ